MRELSESENARVEVIRTAYATGYKSGTISEALNEIAAEFLNKGRSEAAKECLQVMNDAFQSEGVTIWAEQRARVTICERFDTES